MSCSYHAPAWNREPNAETLVEPVRLELQLGGANQSEQAAVRTEAPPQVARGYEEAVAEYFRRLSEAPAR